ncbi:MAG: phage integrase SAM-like domain-containing protein [Saprospiraceae bacterium]|nr:phage integrase SAM-like domain-containing protein [Saprospiraceae bacterium]
MVSEIEKFISNTELQNRILSLEELKNHLNLQFDGGDKLHMAPEKKALTLNDYISIFIEDIRDGHRTYTSRQGERIQYAKSSVKVYKEFKTQFDLFQTNRYKLNFGDIDLTFYDNFVTYFSKKNYKTNAIGKQIKCLKTNANAALEEDVHNNLIFQKKDFKTLKSDVDNVYLDTEELKLLHEIDLSGKPHLELTRDIFLCGCYTALRYSDYSRLSSEYIVQKDGQFYIDMITLKN